MIDKHLYRVVASLDAGGVLLGGKMAARKTDGKPSKTTARGREELDALARLIEYASRDAKDNGLFLTGHLLDLAGWSLQDAKAHLPGQPRAPRRARDPDAKD